ncbi:NYN domain-containing protein [Romboutsia maritimum]|uniref:NYN domain-containing protein n=1 Tax=Romboutsia maritimum TaxID=2020948 RepID=A0A371IQJ8_9FIRM|nr:NYN domain-containing protein [Romboutsia maritimum]RDY22760.1 NYN domain-containing protein [Romboutsia maritimum]
MSRKINHYLIIDGYNIINAWEELKNLARTDLEHAREKLINDVIEYAEFTGKKAIVVFDAYNVKGFREKIEQRKYITVVYTKEHQTADSYIEKYITSLSKYDDVKVATNDYAEQQIVLGKGASRISSRELKLDLDHARNKMREQNSSSTKKIQRNWLEERLDKETLSKLENIRRMR